MDKSWMTKFRGSKEYLEGVKLFITFAVSNSGSQKFILCPCKKCRLNKQLRPQEVYDHLTTGAGILPTYIDWVWHGEKIGPHAEGSNSTRLAAATAPILDESINMQAMLRELFNKHEVREEVDEDSARKFFNLLKQAEKPLHDKTNHSKLSAIIHMYNLKCVGGVSDTAFTSLLEFINQLLPTDAEALPNSTDEAKKFLRDMASAGTTNICAVPNTESPAPVRVKSSIASRLGNVVYCLITSI